jgi:hypothetical protein
MLEQGATTTWEGFVGDAKDSLCHPWSTAPFLHLMTAEQENKIAIGEPINLTVAQPPGSVARNDGVC